MRLFELFDQTYPVHLQNIGGEFENVFASTTKLPDGSVLRIIFEMSEPDTNGDTWFVGFTRDGSYSNKGQGDQFKVFATVIKAIGEFIQMKSPYMLHFTASKMDYDIGKYSDVENSRVKLYDKMLNRYAKKYGYEVDREETPISMQYRLWEIG